MMDGYGESIRVQGHSSARFEGSDLSISEAVPKGGIPTLRFALLSLRALARSTIALLFSSSCCNVLSSPRVALCNSSKSYSECV